MDSAGNKHASSMKPLRIDLFGVSLDCVNMQQATEYVDEMVSGDKPQTIIAVNPEKIMRAQTDPSLMSFLNASGLLIPDGIGAVVAARILKGAKLSRVPGAELMPAICQQSLEKGYRLFLLGANPDINQKTVSVLKETYPGINIVGHHHGYFTQEEESNIVDMINDSGADVLFVALGSPRQELWMESNLQNLHIKVCQGVGGTFDVISGNIKRAPYFFRMLNLEWFYRLVSQPKRLLRQTALPKFAYKVLKEKFLSKK